MVRIVAVAAAGWIAASLTATASASPPKLIIRMYDAFGVASQQLTTAQATVRAILNDAGIDLKWHDCRSVGRSESSSSSCEEPVGLDEVVVRIVEAGPRTPLGPLGYSLVDGQRIGCLATVFGDRVAAMGARAHADAGKLLGRAIGHEVGHILLGTAHSSVGLMRARWYDDELQRDLKTDWALSGREAKAMRLVLQSQSQPPQPPVLIAGIVR